MQHFVSVLLFALACRVQGQRHEDQVFAYSQVMTNCVGQQFTDQQTARIITAVRRCEQVLVQPLRDRALEQVIADLSSPLGGGGRVIYVPVAVPPGSLGGGLGGVGGALGGGLGGVGFDQFGGAGLGQPFGAAGFGGLQGTQPGFNNFNSLNSLDNNFGRPDLTFSPSNAFGGFAQTTTGRPGVRPNNPFGLFGKQTTEGETAAVVSQPETEELTQDKGSTLKREKRQVAGDRFTRAEALYYLSNMTCVLREAGMIDHNNLPNYQFAENELRRTQLDRQLRNDFASGLLFCKELTQCMPVERLNHPLARELGQAIAYFRCIARSNVKACRKQEERRNQGSARLTGAFNFFNGNGRDLLRSVTELALSDDALGFDFF